MLTCLICGGSIAPTGRRGRPRKTHRDCDDLAELQRAEAAERGIRTAKLSTRLTIEARAYAWPRTGYPNQYSSGRGGMGSRPYRRNRLTVLESDICGLCGHGGAKHVDHIIGFRQWPRIDGKLIPGFDDVENLQPAHGSGKPNNPCETCGLFCNNDKR